MIHSLTLIVAAAIGISTLAACSAGPNARAAGPPALAPDGARSTESPSAPRLRAPTTPPPPTTISDSGGDVSRPLYATTAPLYSFDRSVPPPDIVNTGTDYVAVARSLLGYVSWLKLHNPDVTLLPNVYVEGTALVERFSPDLAYLAEHDLRLVDVDQSVEIAAVSIDDDLVTSRVLEHITAERLVDPTGKVVDERPSGPLNAYIVVMAIGPDQRWRIADITAAYTEPRVQP